MDRKSYLRSVIELYLEQPDTPASARRRDWAVAATLYREGIALETVAHVIRLATLRRLFRDSTAPPLEPVHSLAYYRQALANLSSDDYEPNYIDYVEGQYAGRLAELRTRATKTAG